MTHCKTKQIKTAHNNYTKSNLYCLSDCYGTHSRNKENAFQYCLSLKEAYNGIQLRIISYNSQCFSVGFIGEIDGQRAFFYITRDYDRYILLNEI